MVMTQDRNGKKRETETHYRGKKSTGTTHV